MGCIKVDEKLQKSEELSNFILFLFKENRIKIPKFSLFQILLSKTRPGLDSDSISSEIISKFDKIGIPSGPLENGTPNVMEEYTKVVMDELVDALQSDMRVDVAIDAGMTVLGSGANAGGPVVTTGSNPTPHSGSGLAT
tara:strand:- start:1373 stop:1789 length:417 start_codon:yes stop_codon:yes gene_type:complete